METQVETGIRPIINVGFISLHNVLTAGDHNTLVRDLEREIYATIQEAGNSGISRAKLHQTILGSEIKMYRKHEDMLRRAYMEAFDILKNTGEIIQKDKGPYTIITLA